MTSLAHLCY